MFDMFISAFSSACSMEALVANFIGVALGIVFGALPGLTAVMGVALLIPLTFGFPAVIAFSALLGMYCGAIYAGSITAILVGTPGTAAAAATMLEGPKFTARGESLKALEMTTIASFIGGIFSCIVLATVAPQLAHFALDFSAPEYFSLGIFGLTIVATLSEGALLKGCIAALLGMLISMIGMDPLSGNLRMTFDSPDLINGVSLVPALVGLYALSQVLVTIEDVFMGRKLSTAEISRKGISLPDLWANRAALIRGSLFGTFIGIVPATGSGTASFAAYSETKRHSKHPELFGKGTLEGIAATESANNAVTGGALIPLLTLGVPGDVVTAIMLGALMIQGMTPGPLLFQEQGTLVYSIFIALFVSNVFMLLLGCARGGNLRIRLKNVCFRRDLFLEIGKGGLPSLCRQGLASIATICLNRSAGLYGDAAIAAMSVVSRAMMLAQSALIGFGQGFQPVCGFNYGAGLYHRVKEGFRFCVKWSTVFLTAVSVLGLILAPQIIAVFRNDPEVIAFGARALRLQCLVFPLCGVIVISSMLTQTINKVWQASVLAVARQGLFFIPAVLALPHIWGELGVQLAQPVSDVCAFALTVPLVLGVLRDMDRQQRLEKIR